MECARCPAQESRYQLVPDIRNDALGSAANDGDEDTAVFEILCRLAVERLATSGIVDAVELVAPILLGQEGLQGVMSLVVNHLNKQECEPRMHHLRGFSPFKLL